MRNFLNITEEEKNSILEMHISKHTIKEQPTSNLLNTDLGKKVKSYTDNLLGQLPIYWSKLKNMNPNYQEFKLFNSSSKSLIVLRRR
jgi:hypothetical protein